MGNIKGLTKVQREVLHYLTVLKLSPKEILSRRGGTPQNLGQIIKKLGKKGYLDDQNKNAFIKGGVPSVLKAKWRYHALQFIVRPYYFYPRYKRTREQSGNYGINYGDWVFRLHDDMVEVYLKEFVDFADVSKYEAIDKARASFNKYVSRAAEKYGFEYVKDQKVNIKLVKHHLACSGSGVAKARKDARYAQLCSYRDGKVFFTFDASRGLREHEYVHPDRAVSDSEKLEPVFNSYVNNDCMMPHEMTAYLQTIIKVQADYAANIQQHLVVMQKMSDTLDQQNKIIKKQNTMLNRLNKSISAKKV